MLTRKPDAVREKPDRAQLESDELGDADEASAPLAVRPERSGLDARKLLALQKTAGNAAVSRLLQETRAREQKSRGNGAVLSPFIDAYAQLEQAKKPRSFFGKAFDFVKGLGQKAVGGGKSFFAKAFEFVKRTGGKAVVGGKSAFAKALELAKRFGGKAVAGGRSFFGKAFGAAKGGAQKAFGAVKGGAKKVIGAAKGAGQKVVAGAEKAASGPKGFFEIVLSWARKMFGFGAKEAKEALSGKEEPGEGAAKKPGKGAPGLKDKAPKAGAAGSASGAGGRAREGGGGGGAPAGPSVDGQGPAGVETGADGTAERPKTPEDDPRFQAFKGQVGATAQKTKAHAPAAAKATEAQGAAKGPANEVASQAKGAQVEEMAAQKPGTFDKKAFMDAVKKAIEAASPKNLKEATEFSKSGKAGEVKDKVAGMVTQNKEAAEQGIKEKTEAEPDPSKGEAKEVVPMSEEKPGPRPGPVGAAGAMPPPATAAEVDLSQGPRDIEQQMADNEVTEEQLRESNEPEMIGAADSKKEAEKHAAEAPAAYRADEAGILDSAKGEAQETAAGGLEGMHKSKAGALLQIAGSKKKTQSADEAKRAKVAGDMETIYGKTKTDVSKILDGIEPKVTAAFDTGEQKARQAFESYVGAQMSAYKEKRYSGWRGKLRWLRDKFLGMPDAVNKFYETGKSQYLAAMDGVIESVATIVGNDLNAARARIAQGQVEIKKYVDGLPKDLKKLGKEAESEMGEKFAALEGEVDSKSEELVQTIANKYVESRDALDKRIEELKEANKGLVAKAIDAVKGAIQTILKLKDLLMTVLRKAISVIGDILAHPIRFIENFMSGVKAGLNLFVDKIEDYLKQALIGWLFGPSVLGGTKIEAPKDLDFKGIVSIVLQALGLTKDAILDLLRKKVGAPAVEKLKQGVEWVTLLATEGPAGLWKFVQEKVGDLYETVVGGIMDFLKTKVIKAGIMWLISLLNPAGALIKIVKAIVDVVTFIFERAEQIADFINSILDAVIAVAKGNTGGVAQKIADGLGKGLSLAIGFLASLLGLTGIGAMVRGIIDKVRAPVKRVVNKLIDGAVKMAKRLFGRPAAYLKAKYEKGKAKVKEVYGKGKALAEKGVAWAMGKLGIAPFKAAGEKHEVYAEIVGEKAEVKVASDTPKDPERFLDDLWKERIEPLPDGPDKQALIPLWDAAKGSAGEVPTQVAQLAKVPGMPKKGTTSKEVQALLTALALDLQRLMDAARRPIATGGPRDPIPIVYYKKREHYPEKIWLPRVPGYEEKGIETFPIDFDEEITVPHDKGRASLGTWEEHDIDVGGAGGDEGASERADLERIHYREEMERREERKAKAKAKGKRIPPKRDELHRLVNLGGLKIKLGVEPQFMPEELMERSKSTPLFRVKKDYDTQELRKTKGAELYKQILKAFGFKWDDPAHDPDHVMDIGFHGPDDPEQGNFWPTPKEINQKQFTRVYSQVVVYLDENGEVARSTVGQLKGKHFKIVELQ